MVKGCHELTVHAVSAFQARGPVFYASMPRADETLKGRGLSGAGDRHFLVSALWDHLLAIESPLWKSFQSPGGAAFPLQVISGLLGRPQLLLGAYPGPAISLSQGGGRVWAALCGDNCAIGIDVAGADEFPRDYPVHRVFHPQELQRVLLLVGGDLGVASALLWSVKEAAVKALGCGFHLVDPLQVRVTASGAEKEGWHAFTAGLAGTALVLFPAAGQAVAVRSRTVGQGWLSIAMLEKQPACKRKRVMDGEVCTGVSQ